MTSFGFSKTFACSISNCTHLDRAEAEERNRRKTSHSHIAVVICDDMQPGNLMSW